MEDTASVQASQLRQPKKRFVGRRAADAQAQKDPAAPSDVESTQVQKGMQDLPGFFEDTL
jgi:2-(3-amino-3-carboxypropyl)histidine synthase